MSEVSQVAAAWAFVAFAASAWLAFFLFMSNRFHTWDRVREAVEIEREYWEARFKILQRQIETVESMSRRAG